MGRFLNCDSVFDYDAGLQGYNLSAYCGNNPAKRIDAAGTDSIKIDEDDITDDEFMLYGGGGNGFSSPSGGNGTGSMIGNITQIKPPDLYHYTTAVGAEGITRTGVIVPDNRGRVFVTTDKIPAADVNNAFFMGLKPGSGTHVVEIYLFDPYDFRLVVNGVTQPNELIYMGALRNGKNAVLIVKENLFDGRG